MYRKDYAQLDLEDVNPRGSFLGSVFGAIEHVVGGAVTGLIGTGGNPIGGILGAVAGTASGIRANMNADAVQANAAPIGGSPAGTPAAAPLRLPPPTAMAGGARPGIITASPLGTPVSAAAIARQQAALGGGGVGRVMRPSGKGFFTARHLHAVAMGRSRAKPRMNWANGHALGRAERRIKSAVHHMSRYIRWVHPKKEGHAAPKFHRARRAA